MTFMFSKASEIVAFRIVFKALNFIYEILRALRCQI